MIKPDWDTNASLYAASILAKHLQALQVEIDGVHLNLDPEYVHRMRVASRRFRNALEIFGFSFSEKDLSRWLKSIKNITGALGKARDKDVQIIFVQNKLLEIEDPKLAPGLKRIILRLKQNRSDCQEQVSLSLSALTNSKELAEIQSRVASMGRIPPTVPETSPALYRLGWEIILKQLQEFLAFEVFIADSSNISQLHAMRIAAKKLRYSLEIFSPVYLDELNSYLQAVRQTQDYLGTIHDSFVWNQYLSNFISEEKKRAIAFYGVARGIHALEPGIKYLTQWQLKNYQDQYQSFISSWQIWQANNLWQDLVNSLKAPLF